MTAQTERFATLPYPRGVRERVLEMARGTGSPADVATLHYHLGGLFGQAALAVLDGEEADVIGSHGQTVAHVTAGPIRATLQLGAPALIAAQTGSTVVSDFRAADIAACGEGAPLVSFVDCLLLRHPSKRRVLLNIGGIANVTYLPPTSSADRPAAFDTGPGNAPIDRAVEIVTAGAISYDRDGLLAAEGAVDSELLRDLLEHPFLRRAPPKSTGLEEFGRPFAEGVIKQGQSRGLSATDILATLTRFTAASIARGIAQLAQVDEIVVTGGGVRNGTLLRFLREEVEPMPVTAGETLGMPSDAKEAIAFAVLANQTIRGLPGALPACTGAVYPAVLGSITPGRNFAQLMRRIWNDANTGD